MELNFDATTVAPATAFVPVPAGWYKAVIAASEEKTNKAQTGSYLQLEIQIIEGDHAGRKVFDRLNLNNPNQTASEIAQRTLSAICHAVGVLTPRMASDLHDKPMMIKVAVSPARDGYEPGNEVKGYEAVKASETPAPSTGGASAPWKKK